MNQWSVRELDQHEIIYNNFIDNVTKELKLMGVKSNMPFIDTLSHHIMDMFKII